MPITLSIETCDLFSDTPGEIPLKGKQDLDISRVPLQTKIRGLAGWALGISIAIHCDGTYRYVSYDDLDAWVRKNRVDPDASLLDLNRIILEVKKYQSALISLKESVSNLNSISNDLLQDRRFIELALKQNGLLLQNLPLYQDDEALLDVAIRSNPEALTFASSRLRWKKTVEETIAHLKIHPKDINLLPEEFFADPQFMHAAIQLPPFLTENSPSYIKKNIALVKAQINQSRDLYHHIDPLLKDDETLYLLAYADKKPLKKAQDAFQLAHLALHRAKQRMSGMAYDAFFERKQYLLASYYILLEMSIAYDNCSGPYLSLDEAVETQPPCSKKRKPLEVFEKDPKTGNVKKQSIQLSLDIFTSLKTASDPVPLKKLIQKNPDAFISFSEKLLHPEQNAFTPVEKELFDGLIPLGNALQDQFIEEDPHPLFGPPLYRAFQALIQEGVLSEENQYACTISEAIGSIAASEILLKKTTLSQDETPSVTIKGDDGANLQFKLPLQNLFGDPEAHHPFFAPFLTPFSGRLAGEENVSLISREYENILKQKNALNENDLLLLSYLVYKRAIDPLKNNKLTKAMVSEEVFRTVQKDASTSPKQRAREATLFFGKRTSFECTEKKFQALQSLVEDIEKVGELVGKRYLSSRLHHFLSSVEFNALGKVSSIHYLALNEPLVTRTEQEHTHIISRYLSGINVPLRPRRMPPRFDRAKDKSFLLSELFHRISSNDPTGSCCVGALAQGIGGKYNPITGSPLSSDYSLNMTWINALRKGAAEYMREHPEEFSDYVDGDDKKKAVLNRAGKIDQNGVNFWKEEGWFSLAEIKAISSIIGRPVHIITRHTSHFRLTPDGEIESIKINDHFNHEILYLLYREPHFWLLSPRRSSTLPLPYWEIVLRD